MNMNIIPANSKRSMLIFSLFKPSDLIIFGVGLTLTLIFLITISADNIGSIFLKLGPLLIGTFLILPVPNYHNIRTLIKEIYLYYMNRRIYVWRGWCFTDEFKK